MTIELTNFQIAITIISFIVITIQAFVAGFIAVDMDDSSPIVRSIACFCITIFGIVIVVALLLWEIPKRLYYTFCIKDAWSLRFTTKLNNLTEEQLNNLNQLYTAWYYSNKSIKRYFKLKTFKQIAKRNKHTLILNKQIAPH